jgi:DNA-binding protein H-NS
VTLASTLVPDYLLRPQYQTQESKKLAAMENQIGDLTKFLQGFESRMEEQQRSMKATLEANTVVLKDFTTWKSTVQADVLQLQNGLRDLNIKLDKLIQKDEQPPIAAHKVFDVGDLRIPPRP